MKRRNVIWGGLALLLLPCFAAPKASHYQLLRTSFECPLGLSKPVKVGLDASSMSFPAQPQKAEFEVMVCEIDRQAFTSLKEAGQDPAVYAKTTYLGVTKPAPQKGTRKFVQGPQSSDVYPESFPTKDYLEIFWLERKEGAGVMLAFRVSKSMDKKQANAAMEQICSTFQWKI